MEGSTRPGKTVGVLFIDFKKAFDSVYRKTLNIKMQACGISGDVLNWLNDYLDNRRQFVEIGEHTSDTKSIDYGVPQRSLLGPRLFRIKVTDLPECRDSGTVELFADDTESYCIGDSPVKATISLQKIILDIHMWCRKKNGLTIHPDKTEAMIISQKNLYRSTPSSKTR